MPKSEKLPKLIERKLTQLQKLLDKADEVRVIQADEPETWDSDVLATLVTNCRKILKILEDKTDPKLKNPWGEPMVTEEGLCSLVDSYQAEEEEESENI